MAGELKELKPRNIFALGLIGFSGAFAFFLLRELFVEHDGFVAAGFNLVAAVLLMIVCAISWPQVSSPKSARVSWRSVALAIGACVLALAARLPGVHV